MKTTPEIKRKYTKRSKDQKISEIKYKITYHTKHLDTLLAKLEALNTPPITPPAG